MAHPTRVCTRAAVKTCWRLCALMLAAIGLARVSVYRFHNRRPLDESRDLPGAFWSAQAVHWLVEGRFQCGA